MATDCLNSSCDYARSVHGAFGGGPAKWIGSIILKLLVPPSELPSSVMHGSQYCKLPGNMMQPLGAFDKFNCSKNSLAMLGVFNVK